jgi:hypothetical protein
MSTVKTPENSLPPVRTREDCFSWVTETELQDELWAAYRAAVRHYREFDFEAECIADSAGEPVANSFITGTLISTLDGRPWAGRGSFFTLLLSLVVWRFEALAERRGVSYDPCLSPPGDLPAGCATASDVFKHPFFGPILGGPVLTLDLGSRGEARAFMRALKKMALKKKAPAGVASTTEAMTTVKRTNDDGTNCRG